MYFCKIHEGISRTKINRQGNQIKYLCFYLKDGGEILVNLVLISLCNEPVLISLCNEHPRKPHFISEKGGFTGVCLFVLILAKQHRL